MSDTHEAKTLEGIVLRAYPSGESDLVLRILTPAEGKISAIAKHVRKSGKRFSGTLDLFDCGRFEIHSGRGSLPLVRGFNPITSFAALRGSLDKIAAAALLCETIDYLSLEGAGHEEHNQYETLVLGLRTIESATSRAEILSAAYDCCAHLVLQAGFLDPAQLGAGTTKKLRLLLNHIETCVEKKLTARPAFDSVIDAFSREASQ